MLTLLVAVDGSECSIKAVRYATARAASAQPASHIHLVNVQHPVHGSVAAFVDAGQIKQYHQDEGMKALESARAVLAAENIAYEHHVFIGDPAEVIARFAQEQSCDEIIVGTRGHSGVSGLLLGSVASKIIHHAPVPVVLVK